MVTVPAVTPVTMPDAEPTEAIAGLLLLHVPPASGSPSVIVVPAHTGELPVIAEGTELTVIVAVARQPVGRA